LLHPWGFSRYATRVIAAGKISCEALEASAAIPWTRSRLIERLASLQQSSSVVDLEHRLMASLRLLRTEVLLGVMARDLGGSTDLAGLRAVMETMTLLAEVAVQAGVAFLHEDLRQRHGTPLGAESGAAQEMLVVGMGKLGGRELNVSSDIDLIFVYEEDGETDGQGSMGRISNHDFFWRMGQRLNALLSEVTSDGFVFRVDLLLRPNGRAGPLAVSLAMLEEYFIIQGRDWERYAWIKARVISDPERMGVTRGSAALAQLTTSFVYRRHLDYSVISAMRTLHRQIREETNQKDARQSQWKGADIKLGRGGIREIEFAVQVFQLIRGGQDSTLRLIPTLAMLPRLGERGILPADVAQALQEHYVFLRHLEHRLQYLEDAQTHSLPMEAEDQLRVAQAMGFNDYTQFKSALDERLQAVALLFDSIFSAETAPPSDDAGEQLWALAQITSSENIAESPQRELLQKLISICHSTRYRAQNERTREQFDIAMGRGLSLILKKYHGSALDSVINRFLHFMEAISRRASYLMLLVDYPIVMDRLLSLLAASEWAARYVSQRPQLLDEFLNQPDEQRDDFAGYWERFRAKLYVRLMELEGDTEGQMDLLRRQRHAETFRILLHDLDGELKVEQVADRLSALADVMMILVLGVAWRQVPQRHCEEPRFAVIAYGKWGSKEMGYDSDLDLVFLYQDDHELAQNNYVLLTRKISQWMTTLTGAGILYDVDMQLRPNGNAGVLVSPLEAFQHYQLQDRDNSAWVWEHQALTRARFCCGDRTIGTAFDDIRRTVLLRVRAMDALRLEILHMRQLMHQGNINNSDRFDVKHDTGGMVDVEFIVQTLVLAHAHQYPELIDNVGNVALLQRAGKIGLIDSALAEQVAIGYARLRGFQHQERLKGADKARVDVALVADIRPAVIALWNEVLHP
jgi:glutamate-ammonia-ligase adenylyltransferase